MLTFGEFMPKNNPSITTEQKNELLNLLLKSDSSRINTAEVITNYLNSFYEQNPERLLNLYNIYSGLKGDFIAGESSKEKEHGIANYVNTILHTEAEDNFVESISRNIKNFKKVNFGLNNISKILQYDDYNKSFDRIELVGKNVDKLVNLGMEADDIIYLLSKLPEKNFKVLEYIADNSEKIKPLTDNSEDSKKLTSNEVRSIIIGGQSNDNYKKHEVKIDVLEHFINKVEGLYNLGLNGESLISILYKDKTSAIDNILNYGEKLISEVDKESNFNNYYLIKITSNLSESSMKLLTENLNKLQDHGFNNLKDLNDLSDNIKSEDALNAFINNLDRYKEAGIPKDLALKIVATNSVERIEYAPTAVELFKGTGLSAAAVNKICLEANYSKVVESVAANTKEFLAAGLSESLIIELAIVKNMEAYNKMIGIFAKTPTPEVTTAKGVELSADNSPKTGVA
jgi:hypothetical protein